MNSEILFDKNDENFHVPFLPSESVARNISASWHGNRKMDKNEKNGRGGKKRVWAGQRTILISIISFLIDVRFALRFGKQRSLFMSFVPILPIFPDSFLRNMSAKYCYGSIKGKT